MTSFSSIVIGNESLLVQCCDKLLARGNRIAAVVTTNPGIADWARAKGLEVVAQGPGLADRLAGHRADWLLSIANLAIIPKAVLALADKGAVNFHDGPLPRHAGLNAPVWALIEGEARHGISWHLIEGGVDEGDVLVSRGFDIAWDDTALTLNAKAYEAAIDSFPDLLDQLESGALRRTSQDLSGRTYHARNDRPGGHGLLRFDRPAADLARLVQALDHGGYWNPLCVAKVRSDSGLWLVSQTRAVPGEGAPGTVLAADGDTLTVACADRALALSGLTHLDGAAASARDVAPVGARLQGPDDATVAALEARLAQVTPHDKWWRTRLGDLAPAGLTGDTGTAGEILSLDIGLPDTGLPDTGLIAAAVAAWAAQMTDRQSFDLAFADKTLADLAQDGLVAPWAPVRVAAQGSLKDVAAQLETALADRARRVGFASDLPHRAPELAAPAVPAIGLSAGAGHVAGTALTVDMDRGALSFDSGRLSPDRAALLAARLSMVLGAAAETRLDALPTLTRTERDAALDRWNATAKEHDRALVMHRAFEAQVARTPDATAVIFEDQRLSYAALNARANKAAHVLRAMGVGPDTVVGLCCARGPALLIGALAILKAGGAYLPMDPGYPADRLEHFVQDSGAAVIVTLAAQEPDLPRHDAQLLVLDADPALHHASDENLAETSAPADLAYLIYTSGSTGKPKGVMVEHRNVLNFYAGMDDVVDHAQGGTWLAVTSLSFDISVLELFYTTARGFTVVMTSDETRGLISNGPLRAGGNGMQFSVYYWGNDDGVGRDKYRLLLEGAQFADENGFVAVWTPERHFHAFGGPYPNPSVTGAAVAAVTRNIGVRAGSVVAPLHHPARIAEEWAVIDNLTNGRAGLAIASGWQPDDFILRPENTPPNNKSAMAENIDQLRRLWRGEAVGFPRANGEMHEVVTQPRPVSRELPVWVTTAGNPKTWQEAGAKGCNVLTHLLGQSVDEVAEKIALYHAALREAGHDPADFTVTLMLHTYLSDSRNHAREIARGPMKAYLRSAAGLIKQYAWAFPAFKRPEGVDNAFDLQLDGLEPEELDAILDFAFERYFNDSGLFGTVDDAIARAEQLKRIGVDEIACLIDYGIAREDVLTGLRPLAEVVRATQAAPELEADDHSIAAQILRHGVTHLQCTPSMARMIAMNDEARLALRDVQHLYFGGEPLPGALVREFAQITQAAVTNMYGPTETTIWSSTAAAAPSDGVVGLGMPIANTQLYVLDAARQPVGLGEDGELWIGGEGVTRGYWNRPELTAERFADNPFHAGRMYRTGDLVRREAEGALTFLGRVDHQIKLRGHRIELGEIEAAMETLDGLTQAVVSAQTMADGDVRLVGYYTGAVQAEARLKAALSDRLPAIMVPGRMVWLEAFPLTPNKKVDRAALPAPTVAEQASPAPAPAVVEASPLVAQGASESDVQAKVAAIWARLLGVDGITGRSNFFDLGGHSLLAVQAHRALREELGAARLAITDIFRFPVLQDLAKRVAAVADLAAAKPRGEAAARPVVLAEPAVPPAEAAALPQPVAVSTHPRNDALAQAMARRRAMRARRAGQRGA